jgi:FeS assembly protein IscX
MADTFDWLDVQRIAEELADAHPRRNPYAVTFPELRGLVTQLPGFAERAGHPVNERILEEIQRLWAEEAEGLSGEDEE